MTTATITRKQEAIEHLNANIKPGDKLFTQIRHVSASGMSRDVSVYQVRDGEPINISGTVAEVIGGKFNRDYCAIRVGGCGFDAGFEVVYQLSYALHGKGFECIGQNCPSNDHSNGDRDYTPHMHKEGGYSLRHNRLA